MNTSVIYAVVLFVLVVIFWLFMSYTGFKRMKNSSADAFRAVTMCYEARRKTAGSLIRLMKNYIKGEDDVIQQAADLFASAEAAELPGELIAAESGVVDGIQMLMETSEKYGDFAESKRYRKIVEELQLDDRNIATTIRIYNTIAKTYNEKVHGVLTKFAAKLCGFKDIPMI
jgi:hypothetical protein